MTQADILKGKAAFPDKTVQGSHCAEGQWALEHLLGEKCLEGHEQLCVLGSLHF